MVSKVWAFKNVADPMHSVQSGPGFKAYLVGENIHSPDRLAMVARMATMAIAVTALLLIEDGFSIG